MALSNDIAILTAHLDARRFALPGLASDSWITTGIPRIRAASVVGTLPYPPLLITTSGYSLKRVKRAEIVPTIVIKESVKFLIDAYRRTFPVVVLIKMIPFSKSAFSSNEVGAM